MYCINGNWTADFPTCVDICSSDKSPSCGSDQFCEEGECKCQDGFKKDEDNNSTDCIPNECYRYEIAGGYPMTGSFTTMRRYCRKRGGDLIYTGLDTMESRRDTIYSKLGYGSIVNSFWIGIKRTGGRWQYVNKTELNDDEILWNQRDTIEYRKYPSLNRSDADGRCVYINVDWFMRDSRNDLKSNRNKCRKHRAAICQYKC